MRITDIEHGVHIDATNTIIIGANGPVVKLDGRNSLTWHMGSIVHMDLFGKGWMGRVRMALWVYKQVAVMRSRLTEQQRAEAIQIRVRS